MDIFKLEELLKQNNQPNFRRKQITKAIFQDGVSSFSEISTLPKDLREILEKETEILSLKQEKILEAKDGQSVKALFRTLDNHYLESVLISPKPGTWSVCVSTQIGCPMSCEFCATGKMGFKRNLTAEEITDQVLFWVQYLQKLQITNFKSQINFNLKTQNNNSKLENRNSKISNVVYMGMGEPFLNWGEVSKSLADLINPNLFGFGSRSISVSTSGIPEGIEKLADEFPQINLAISLHFASDAKRSEWMPVNRKYNLEVLRNTLRNYLLTTNRKIFLEYIMLEEVNDSLEEADELINYIKSIGQTHLLHVNLIRYNSLSIDNDQGTMINKKIKPSSVGVTREFKDYLIRNGINATIRKSLGSEIQGACGQLAGKNQDN